MKINTRKALNPAYRKHKPLRKEVNHFTEELLSCLKAVKEINLANESEEHIKEPIKTFFHKTFYKDNYINTKNRIDLAIYLGKDMKSDVGVIIETKKPSNKAEFLTTDHLNRKALHELLLYYLRERVDEKNNNIKHLIATNGYEWFLFKAEDFYNLFYTNKSLLKEYEAFRDGKKDSTKNELFYNEIADKYIALVEEKLPFVYLDFTKKHIKEYNDSALNTLYKIFSDVHLLGNSFGNDSNQLNKTFYNELLHIIGLEEVKVKGKKLIQRKEDKQRDYGTLLENTIFMLEDRDYLSNIRSIESGTEKAFNAGLELTLTWINRILFLKLLESQLLTYHNKAKEYGFLNFDFIRGFDDLNDLFFSALAKKPEERHPKFKDRFKYIPYLNSSLFERSAIEKEAFTISALQDEEMHIYKSTVLKDAQGKILKGQINTLEYLFRFLDAYDFAADGTEGIANEEERKTLINASVLGLIFEKINGYKEGSFYTPAYITMYMSRETLRRAVVQKFNKYLDLELETFDELKNFIAGKNKPDELKDYNKIIDSIRIVDPAVGSGHFLVSALNELIAIKSELRLLIDTNGIRIHSDIIVDNDELFVTDEYGHLLEYKPDNRATATIQQTLFHEKQKLIENSLFGVDINPNSVKICRLRLWIELLKNAYYTEEGQLQTLPNIDINIKTGNSLISRFKLDDDLEEAFKGDEVQYSFADYKNAVAEYKNTNDKNRKNEILNIITEVKGNFQSSFDDKLKKKLEKTIGDYQKEKTRIDNLQQFGEKISKAEKDKLKKLKAKYDTANAQVEEILNNKIYHNAFEWRFEFPEVLDNDGNYLGFDVVIGNPPWVSLMGKHSVYINESLKDHYYKIYPENTYMPNLYEYFVQKSLELTVENGLNCLIVPDRLGANEALSYLRKKIIRYSELKEIVYRWDFPEIITDTLTYILKKTVSSDYSILLKHSPNSDFINVKSSDYLATDSIAFKSYTSIKTYELINKIKKYNKLETIAHSTSGFGGKSKQITDTKINQNQIEIIKGRNIFRYGIVNTLYFEFIDANITGRTRDEQKLGAKPKILLRKTGLPLIATIDKSGIYPEQSLYIIYNLRDDFKYEYILALINSKLINWYYVNELVTNIDSTPQLKNIDLNKFPIRLTTIESQQPFIEKVNEILAQKKANPQADTTALETEIDQMVYELYELTEEEIAIVEGGQ